MTDENENCDCCYDSQEAKCDCDETTKKESDEEKK